MRGDDESQRALAAFAIVAEEFCLFIDDLREAPPTGCYEKLEHLLARLHATILPVIKDLPEIDHREFDAVRMTGAEYAKVCKGIGRAIAPACRALLDWYQCPSTPNLDEVGRIEMLWDDLADLYRDLWSGLMLWRMGTSDAQAQASWEWRFNFEAHWGEHLFRALKTVHEIRYQIHWD